MLGMSFSLGPTHSIGPVRLRAPPLRASCNGPPNHFVAGTKSGISYFLLFWKIFEWNVDNKPSKKAVELYLEEVRKAFVSLNRAHAPYRTLQIYIELDARLPELDA